NTAGISSLLHIIGGTAAFLLGSLFFGQYQQQMLIIGLIFGFFLAGGHIMQEIQDFEGDHANHIKTTAYLLGKKVSLFIAIGFFVSAHFFFYYLIDINLHPNILWLNILTLLTVILFAFITLRKGLNFKNVFHYRKQYRLVYIIYGFILFLEYL
ncbi:MAG: hypothetical protein GQ527_05730, partial [Bacteroidales bacterium]|nr:hypothetical protein [Bacteroidales bacterium]